METVWLISLVCTLLMSCHLVNSKKWKSPDICMLPVKQGHCMAYYESYFFNRTSGKCEPFIYGGCGGNHNRFHTVEECFKKCSCHVPPDAGPCRASIPKWYYNPKRGCCEKFTYGGCKGNSNNFGTFELCEKWCSGTSTGRKLPWGTNWGSANSLKNGLQWKGIPFMKWGGGKNIWLHNENNLATKGTGRSGGQVVRMVATSGNTQVPGIQTKSNMRLVSSGTVPVGQAGSTFRQMSRVQSVGSPVARTGSSWGRTMSVGGSQPVVGRSMSVGGVRPGSNIGTGGSFRRMSRVQNSVSPIGPRMGGRMSMGGARTGGGRTMTSRGNGGGNGMVRGSMSGRRVGSVGGQPRGGRDRAVSGLASGMASGGSRRVMGRANTPISSGLSSSSRMMSRSGGGMNRGPVRGMATNQIFGKNRVMG